MELKSEPKYETVNVTDIDITFPGDLQTYTLRDGVDGYEFAAGMLTIVLGETGALTFYLQHAHWYAIRKRTIRVLSPATPPAPQEG